MARPLFDAAEVADDRIRAALVHGPGPVMQRAEASHLLSCFSDLHISGKEAIAYAAWCAPHSASLIRGGLDVEEVLLALVARTVLTTQLALKDS